VRAPDFVNPLANQLPAEFLGDTCDRRDGNSRAVEAFVEKISSRTAVRPITVKIAVLVNQQPADYSGDPCDRLIGATVLAEGIALVTRDEGIRACKQIKTIW
jgi:PIN domain nuclease of toxin-antitoxin system